MPIEYHYATLSLQLPHDLRYTILWRYTDQHMYMIRTCLCFYYFYPFLLTQLPQNHSYILFDLPIDFHPTAFGCEYNVDKLFFPGLAGGCLWYHQELKERI